LVVARRDASLQARPVEAGARRRSPRALAYLISQAYRRARLFAFPGQRDPLGSGFRPCRLIAGRLEGILGLVSSGVQKLALPPCSDFIYAIVPRSSGMLGALGIVALFGVVLWRGHARRLCAPTPRYLGWGLTLTLVLQAFTNISVALALLPTKGIPLPFLSYGGSSLVATLAACGVLLNLSQHG
jgi:cell division protein FtsW